MSERNIDNPAHNALRDLGGEVSFHEAGGVLIKAFGLPAGVQVGQHSHKEDHLSVLVAGTADLDDDGKVIRYSHPDILVVPAGKLHKITAVTDTLWLCVHNTDRLEKEIA